ncbi:MAG TPA: hypothetical protein VE777_12800 [Gaiellales bacterium]|nr:hypothetical protein [Gaiellales bacterium]
MGANGDEVMLRVPAATSARAVAEPVLLALGARAGLNIEGLDSLSAAFGVVLGTAGPGTLTIVLRRDDRCLRVTVAPVAPDRLARRRGLLEELAPAYSADGGRIDLHVG